MVSTPSSTVSCLQLPDLQLAPRATIRPIRLRCAACALVANVGSRRNRWSALGSRDRWSRSPSPAARTESRPLRKHATIAMRARSGGHELRSAGKRIHSLTRSRGFACPVTQPSVTCARSARLRHHPRGNRRPTSSSGRLTSSRGNCHVLNAAQSGQPQESATADKPSRRRPRVPGATGVMRAAYTL